MTVAKKLLKGMGIRLSPDHVARLERLAEAMPTVPGARSHTKADALRAAVEEGLRALEKRYKVRT